MTNIKDFQPWKHLKGPLQPIVQWMAMPDFTPSDDNISVQAFAVNFTMGRINVLLNGSEEILNFFLSTRALTSTKMFVFFHMDDGNS